MKKTDHIAQKKAKLDKLSIATTEGFTFVPYETILYLQADNNYTVVYLEDGTKITASKNLGYYEKKLLEQSFVRIHQSYMVNLSKVIRYTKAEGGRLILTNNTSLPVSRKKKESVLRMFR